MSFRKICFLVLPLHCLCSKIRDLALPAGKYAVILRGQTFRAGGRWGASCTPDREVQQMQMANSLVNFVLAPLESASGKPVDLFVTMSPCGLNGKLQQTYGTNRIQRMQEKTFLDQGTGYRGSIDLFKQFLAEEQAPATEYGLIIVTRHDMRFKQSIANLVADWSIPNFLSQCEFSSTHQDCVNDAMQSIPGAAFHTFDNAVGLQCGCLKAGCNDQWDHGHMCKPVLEGAGLRVGFMTSWRPWQRLREQTNPFADIALHVPRRSISTDDFVVVG
eukprot:TRINITY_DN24614_c0_g1_i1.p1 TRINITY_DN24614_c0_g1~~TRINITY_DN24614_c0_g1_i1.p1  ORF type:complete len:288 (-),score=40.96 TRINITY_DN24614_c0_g1_i1:88-909(-)